MNRPLAGKDITDLVELLVTVPELQTADGIRLMLRRANLGFLISKIAFGNTRPEDVLGSLVMSLEAYGKVTYDNDALGMFLNAVRPSVGLMQQAFLDHLISDYAMLQPARDLVLAPLSAPPPPLPQPILEKWRQIGSMRDIAFLSRGLEVARSVALLSVQGNPDRSLGGENWQATAFLIGQRLLLTNFHNLSSPTLLPHALLRFNFQTDFQGHDEPTRDIALLPQGVFIASQELDYVVTELAQDPGTDFPGLTLDATHTVQLGDRVNIIQHPRGLPKKISFQNNLVEYVDKTYIHYQTATDEGSSGSPVFDDQWQVVALHHGVHPPFIRRPT
jgi:hypothetical protein